MNLYTHPLQINISGTNSRNAKVFKERVEALNLTMPCPIEIRFSEAENFETSRYDPKYDAQRNHSWIIYIDLSLTGSKSMILRNLMGRPDVSLTLIYIFRLALGWRPQSGEWKTGFIAHNKTGQYIPSGSYGYIGINDLLMLDFRFLDKAVFYAFVRKNESLDQVNLALNQAGEQPLDNHYDPFLYALLRGHYTPTEFVFNPYFHSLRHPAVQSNLEAFNERKVCESLRNFIVYEQLFDSVSAEFLLWLTEPEFYALSVIP